MQSPLWHHCHRMYVESMPSHMHELVGCHWSFIIEGVRGNSRISVREGEGGVAY